jgi:hypothetical protein
VLEHFDAYAKGSGRLQHQEREAGAETTVYPVLALWEDGR